MSTLISSEIWLPLLLRTLDLLANPTPHNILRSYEAWDYENRLRPQFRQLERTRLLERQGDLHNRTLHVTKAGRLAASGGVDPVQRWQRSWDGRWRMLMFDLPSRRQSLRLRLWRWLRLSRFGYLQHSVWLSPDSVSDETLPLRRLKLTPESFLVFEGRPVGSDTDADLVRSAWDFAAINRRYERVCELAERGTKLARARPVRGNEVHRWLGEDHAAWLAAAQLDPLLPERLWPADYLGRAAWDQRNAALATLAESGRSGRNV
jgi:phenylacetic acid degradation operon negative regulatory protein